MITMALARNMQTGNATFLSNRISDILYISFLRDTVTPIICVPATYSVKLDYMSGPAGFLKNIRHTVFSVRSLWSRYVTFCSG